MKGRLSDDLISGLAAEKAAGSNTQRQRKLGAPVDPDRLASVMEALDAVIARRGVVLPRKTYAAIAAEVYDRWQESGQQEIAIVEKLVESACRPSNQKVRTR